MGRLGWLVVFGVGCVPRGGVRPPEPAPRSSAEVRSAQPRLFYLRAASALASGDREEAVRWAEWVVRVDKSPQAALAAADLLREAGAPGRARPLAERALREAPSEAAHLSLGRILLALGDPAGSRAVLEGAGSLPGVAAARIRAGIAEGAPVDGLLEAWVPVSLPERLERATVTLEAGQPAAARDQALALSTDPALGADAFALAVEAGRAACDLSGVRARASERATDADARWRALVRAVDEAEAEVLADCPRG